MKKHLNIHFIGNSHTYYNDLPRMVSELFASVGVDAHVSMQTAGGKDLLYHCERKDTLFNIIHGGNDYVVLQEVASSFDPDHFFEGLNNIRHNALDKSPTKPVLYMIWANKDNRKFQPTITEAYAKAGLELNAPVAPAGEVWGKLLRSDKTMELYREDLNHATPLGSYIAATCIFYAISGRQRPITLRNDSQACRTAKKYQI